MRKISMKKRGSSFALSWLSSLIIVAAVIVVAILIYFNWDRIIRYLSGSILSGIFG